MKKIIVMCIAIVLFVTLVGCTNNIDNGVNTDDWLTYQNEYYEFKYPEGCNLEVYDDGDVSVSNLNLDFFMVLEIASPFSYANKNFSIDPDNIRDISGHLTYIGKDNFQDSFLVIGENSKELLIMSEYYDPIKSEEILDTLVLLPLFDE